MSEEAKNNLAVTNVVDGYDVYQVVADLWSRMLTRDTEFIQQANIMNVNNSSDLISNELIEETYFKVALEELENQQSELDSIEAELTQILEEGSENEEFEGILFEDGKLMAQGKLPKQKDLDAENDQDVLRFLQKNTELKKQKTALSKQIKDMKLTLSNNVAEETNSLTTEEFNTLLYRKWFGTFEIDMSQLFINALDIELKTLNELNKQYSETLFDIQNEKSNLEKEFLELASQLVRGTSHE